jgi:hypothetical protein
MIVRFQLPNSFLKTEKGDYNPPKEMMDYMKWLFSLDEQDYIQARMFLLPMRFFTTACNTAQNALLPPLFQHMIMEDYYAYRASFTPPPGAIKQ